MRSRVFEGSVHIQLVSHNVHTYGQNIFRGVGTLCTPETVAQEGFFGGFHAFFKLFKILKVFLRSFLLGQRPIMVLQRKESM
jgi:hypothetical protein